MSHHDAPRTGFTSNHLENLSPVVATKAPQGTYGTRRYT